MKVGVVFPQVEIGADPGFLRDYVEEVEELGFSHLLLYDHVLGVDPNRPGGWSTSPPHGPYTAGHQFHEPFVFLAWVAAHTSRLELVTGVLVLPQRQTALVAKQAAELDILSGGRLRLGVGIGWNEVEYEALDQDFQTRGMRLESQVQALRLLWSCPVVDLHDEWHSIGFAGINPRPRRQIPIWMGGMHENVLQRAARLADGWFPQFRPGPEARRLVNKLYGYLRAAGRDPASFGIEGRMNISRTAPAEQVERLREWQDLGVHFISLDTMGASLLPPEHLAVLRRFRATWRSSSAMEGP